MWMDGAVILLLMVVVFYAVAKEREELGCYRFSIGRQCDDDESVYLKNTKMHPEDTHADKIARLKSITSYHEKAGVWKRCVLLSLVYVFALYPIYCLQPVWNVYSFLLMFLVSFTVMYFYHNYLNYHHFRRLKNNAAELLDTL